MVVVTVAVVDLATVVILVTVAAVVLVTAAGDVLVTVALDVLVTVVVLATAVVVALVTVALGVLVTAVVVIVLVTVAAIVVLVGDVDTPALNCSIHGCCSFCSSVLKQGQVHCLLHRSLSLHQYVGRLSGFINTITLSKLSREDAFFSFFFQLFCVVFFLKFPDFKIKACRYLVSRNSNGIANKL